MGGNGTSAAPGSGVFPGVRLQRPSGGYRTLEKIEQFLLDAKTKVLIELVLKDDNLVGYLRSVKASSAEDIVGLFEDLNMVLDVRLKGAISEDRVS